MMCNILWFRNGLRLHDNPSLHEALLGLNNETVLLPLFIFDGESAGTATIGHNRLQFLLECLGSLDEQFREKGGRLYIASGPVIEILAKINKIIKIKKLVFEQDCEPIWIRRDLEVRKYCASEGIQAEERIGHTLWDPSEIVKGNGGIPPLTFSIFNYVTYAIGPPNRPLPDVNFTDVGLVNIELDFMFPGIPTPIELGVYPDKDDIHKVYVGGEKNALEHFKLRLENEIDIFRKGLYLPNRWRPDILCPPKSLSPDLKFGCLSVRKFYWAIMDGYEEVNELQKRNHNNIEIIAPLLWREFFYTSSLNNPFFGEIKRNNICINIPWYETEGNDQLKAFKDGKTGFPFIDAGMKQLYREGWVHHIVRNALACFLTRGDLWISWEEGLQIFLKYLLDADWSVCAGNWMWISSSAFEDVLSCQHCIDPGTFGRRSDPYGKYIVKYIPELQNFPVEYIYEPWKAPLEAQIKAECIVGKDYPHPIVDHKKQSRSNALKMKFFREKLQALSKEKYEYCHPSNEDEARVFMSFESDCSDHSN